MPSDKINITKNFLLLRALTHHSVTFNSRFLKVCVWGGIFYFRSRLFFINYIEEISIKSDAKNTKYLITKTYCKLSANSLAMITQFL